MLPPAVRIESALRSTTYAAPAVPLASPSRNSGPEVVVMFPFTVIPLPASANSSFGNTLEPWNEIEPDVDASSVTRPVTDARSDATISNTAIEPVDEENVTLAASSFCSSAVNLGRTKDGRKCDDPVRVRSPDRLKKLTRRKRHQRWVKTTWSLSRQT